MNSPALMGVVLAFSSAIGIICDFTFPRLFTNKDSRFFNALLFGSVFFFPIAFLLFPTTVGFLLGMAVWGIYFESMLFSKYHLIQERVHHEEHAWAWGILSVVQNLGLVIGPLLASMLFDQDEKFPYIGAICAFLVGTYWYIGVRWSEKRKKIIHRHFTVIPTRSFLKELKIWTIFEKALWPLSLLTIVFFLIDSAFYSIGPLFAEELQSFHPFGGAFVSIYSLPGLLTGMFMGKLSKPFGKKRLAFICGILSGIGLISMSMTTQMWSILGLTFFASIGLGILYTAISATMQDYLGRSTHYTNDLIGLTSICGSIGYVLGPLLNGVLAEVFGTHSVFRVWGIVLTFLSLFLLLTVKRKIRLPQQELSQIEAIA